MNQPMNNKMYNKPQQMNSAVSAAVGAPTTPAPFTPSPAFQDFVKTIGFTSFDDIVAKFPAGTKPQEVQDVFGATSNMLHSNAGIFLKPEPGLVDWGATKGGTKLFSAPETLNANNPRAGEEQLGEVGNVLGQIGAFGSKEEADRYVQYTKLASDQNFQNQITGAVAQGDTRGAMNLFMERLGKPGIDKLKDSDDVQAMGTAFGISTMLQNWDRMNATQRSLGIAGIGVSSYKYATGEDLNSKVLLKSNTPNGPQLTVGGALDLVQTGVNVSSLIKNWDQLDGIQRLTYGVGTASQLAILGKKLGGLGTGPNGAAIPITAEKLGSLGFTANPSAGVGAITGPASSLPPGYTVVASGSVEGTVVAVPQGLENSTATMNGASKISTLNNVAAGSTAALGVYQVMQNWGKGGVEGAANGVVGGTALAQGINQIGAQDPYLMGGIVALSVMGGVMKDGSTASNVAKASVVGAAGYSAVDAVTSSAAAGTASSWLGATGAVVGGVLQTKNILDSEMSNEDKAKGIKRTAEDSAAAYVTLGASAVVQAVDRQYLGGQTDKLRTKYENFQNSKAYAVMNPAGYIANKAMNKAMEFGVGSISGGKGQTQIARDKVRELGQKINVIDKDFSVTLADGSKADVGADGKGEKHEFRFADKVPKGQEVRGLNSYDVDYTNDLDFTANMTTTALMRLAAGGKATAVDQVSGQLANASIKNIGFGQDMTPENFAKMQANVRGFYTQSGIKSKEDAYALANQALADGRLNETDHVATLQGINIAFDEKGYDTAQQLMLGRWKGVQVASEMGAAAGPVMTPDIKPAVQNKPYIDPMSPAAPGRLANLAAFGEDTPEPAPEVAFKFAPSTYNEIPGTKLWDQSLNDWRARQAQIEARVQAQVQNRSSAKNLSKEELRQRNRAMYGS